MSESAGKWMYILAWVCGLGLLAGVFGNLLERHYNPNQQPDSFQSGSMIEVRLKQNRAGHYVTNGTINGQEVTFLVDTGATDVAIPSHMRDKLSLVPGRAGMANTANGLVRIALTEIDTLTIGDIRINNVKANLNPGMTGNEILLGMSVLRQLEFTQRGEWLILRTL